MLFIFVGPALIIFVIGVALFVRLKKRLGVETKVLFPSFFGHLIGWGLLAVLALVIFTVVLTVASESPQGPLWLLFGPWAFAVGEIVGLVRWQGKHEAT
jgi:hypothetical protein